MRHRSTRQLVQDLDSAGRLLRVTDEVDGDLELAEIHRRVYQNGGPALLFEKVRGCQFPVATNLFGSLERARYIFRDTFEAVQLAVRWKVDPAEALKTPWKLWRAPALGLRMRPRKVRSAAVLDQKLELADLPAVKCWPDDGGPFVTLPQVLSQDAANSGTRSAKGLNLGMYRVQLSGNDYAADECGLHYQIHRGIGVHHSEAMRAGKPLRVSITVGGTPAMTVAAVMPLPEGMSELMFAGALGGGSIPVLADGVHAPLYADADFVISGQVHGDAVKPEGPFGDHLGYYAKVHPFPLLKVDRVAARRDAVWPMTVVGRPPQEDTTFGELIHELTSPVIPSVLPGVRQVHAVDAAGVHPLLLAIGSERYTPYSKSDRPQELLTQACAILGQGQLSLAKYLWIINDNDNAPSAEDIPAFFAHALKRIDWRRDLHYHTCTTIDTLDYTGDGLNQGSKLVIAGSGEVKRELITEVPHALNLPEQFSNPKIALPGVLALQVQSGIETEQLWRLLDTLPSDHRLNDFAMIVFVDDSNFTSRDLNNFLWTIFTRSNPSRDTYGLGAFTHEKHFGCTGAFAIDARRKPHHAAGLIEDPETTRKVDARATRGDALAAYL